MVRPRGPVLLCAADLLDPLGVIGERLTGLIVLCIDVPSLIGVAGQPHARKRIVEAPIYGPVSRPVGGYLERLDHVDGAVEGLIDRPEEGGETALDAGLLDLGRPLGNQLVDFLVVDIPTATLSVFVQVGVEHLIGVRQCAYPLLKPALGHDGRHGLCAEAVAVHKPGLNLRPNPETVGLDLLIAVEGVYGAALERFSALLISLELDPVAVG